MKFFDNIMRAIGLKEEEDNEFEFDDEKKDNVVPMFGTKSYGSESHRGYETNRYEESRHTGRDNLIAMPHAQKSVSVVVVEPIGFDEVQKMADYLRNNQPVVINFENTDIIFVIRFAYKIIIKLLIYSSFYIFKIKQLHEFIQIISSVRHGHSVIHDILYRRGYHHAQGAQR